MLWSPRAVWRSLTVVFVPALSSNRASLNSSQRFQLRRFVYFICGPSKHIFIHSRTSPWTVTQPLPYLELLQVGGWGFSAAINS